MVLNGDTTIITVNSKVFYPSHGAGHVKKERTIEFAGEEKRYYEFEFINKRLTVSTPIQNIEKLGIRPVNDVEHIKRNISVLKSTPFQDPNTTDYNKLINIIRELDLQGKVEAFVEIIQYCNHVKKVREAEGKLIPISISKYIKNSIASIVSELAVSGDITIEEAEEMFSANTGLKV